MPIMEEFLDELFGATWFSSLDLRSGFHQILVDKADQYKTTFQTHSGHYEYREMPYGVTGSPATFQHVMNSVLSPLLRKWVVVFIDDILVYSKTWEDHLKDLQVVFALLRQHQFKVKLSKYAFAQQQIPYLGHVISKEGVATDPTKVSIIQNWPTPRCVKEVRSFLGIAGYYKRFVKKFGIMSKTLTNLLRKGEIFNWTQDQDDPFKALKLALSTALCWHFQTLTKHSWLRQMPLTRVLVLCCSTMGTQYLLLAELWAQRIKCCLPMKTSVRLSY